ncbi:hypothetical protein RSOL_352510, partial [Rhizoctonia solani AG-3 Rhs1AP]
MPSPNPLPMPFTTSQLATRVTRMSNPGSPSSFEATPVLANDQFMATYSAERPVSPLPLLSELFLPERRLSVELAVSRVNGKWLEWEHQLILSGLLGPQTPPSLIICLLRLSRRTRNEESLGDLLPLFRNISEVSFRKARGVKPISQQWCHLLDVFEEIEGFAIHFGLDPNSPEFDDIPVLVNRIVRAWRRHVPAGEGWGKLKVTDITTWTYDARNGWLAMVYRRLKEVKIISPLKDWRQLVAVMRTPSHRGRQTQSEASAATPNSEMSPPAPPPSQDALTHELSHHVDELGRGSQPSPVTQPFTAPNGPFTESYEPSSVLVNYLTVDPEALGGSQDATPFPDPHFPSVMGPRPPSSVAHTLNFDHFLELVQGERAKRYKVALEIIRACEPNSTARLSAEAWITWEYFNTHSTDDVARWRAEFELRLLPGANTLNPVQTPTVFTPSITPLSLPSLDELPNSV